MHQIHICSTIRFHSIQLWQYQIIFNLVTVVRNPSTFSHICSWRSCVYCHFFKIWSIIFLERMNKCLLDFWQDKWVLSFQPKYFYLVNCTEEHIQYSHTCSWRWYVYCQYTFSMWSNIFGKNVQIFLRFLAR